MKIILFLLSLFYLPSLSAQKTEKFYDYKWRPTLAYKARYYSLIEKKEDLWRRRDVYISEDKLMKDARYRDSSLTIPQGLYQSFHSNGSLQEKGNYEDGKKTGLWLSFHKNGFLADSALYEDGSVSGIRIQWHSNGFIADSSFYKADGTATVVSWLDDGTPSAAGRLTAEGKMQGKWQFFHPNGALSALETYQDGALTAQQYYDEDGIDMGKIPINSSEPYFPGGYEKWNRWINNKLFWPPDYKIVNADTAIVVVEALINEEGMIREVNVISPFHPAFDEMVVAAFLKSPKWIPARTHNRRIKYRLRDQVTFYNSER